MPLKRGGEGKSSDHISRCGVEAVDPLTPGGGGGWGGLVGVFLFFGREKREREREQQQRAGRG